MKNYCLFIFYFLPFEVFSQILNYEVYHDSINIAESIFLRGDNKASIELYTRIFKKYPFVFAKDCLIAAQIALYDKDTTSALFFTNRAIRQGVKIAFFSKLPIYKDFIKSFSWKRIKKDYKSIRIEYFKSIDFERKKFWASRYNLEQELKNIETLNAYKVKMLDNVNAIVEECKTIGYPGEKILGIDDALLSVKRGENDISSDYAYYSLLHHSCSYSWLKKYFETEIKKGNIHPRQCAYLGDFLKIIRKSAGNDGCDTSIYPNSYIDWTKKCSNVEKIDVNILRYKFHICSIEQELEKEKFEDKTGIKLFFGAGMNRGLL